jgi:hypothetical protein
MCDKQFRYGGASEDTKRQPCIRTFGLSISLG